MSNRDDDAASLRRARTRRYPEQPSYTTTLKRQVKSKDTTIKKLQDDIGRNMMLIKELRQEKTKTEEKLKECESELLDFKDYYHQLFSKKDNEISQLTQENIKIKQELDNPQTQREKLQALTHHTNDEISSLANKAAALSGKKQQLQDNIATLTQEKQQLSSTKTTLETKLSILKAHNEAAKKEKAQLERQLPQIKRHIAELKQQIEAYKKEQPKLTAESTALSKKLEPLRSNHGKLTSTVNELEKKKTALDEKHKQLQNDHNRITNESQHLQTKSQQLEKHNKDLETNISKKEAESQQLEKRNKDMETEISDYNKLITQKEGELKQKQTDLNTTYTKIKDTHAQTTLKTLIITANIEKEKEIAISLYHSVTIKSFMQKIKDNDSFISAATTLLSLSTSDNYKKVAYHLQVIIFDNLVFLNQNAEKLNDTQKQEVNTTLCSIYLSVIEERLDHWPKASVSKSTSSSSFFDEKLPKKKLTKDAEIAIRQFINKLKKIGNLNLNTLYDELDTFIQTCLDHNKGKSSRAVFAQKTLLPLYNELHYYNLITSDSSSGATIKPGH